MLRWFLKCPNNPKGKVSLHGELLYIRKANMFLISFFAFFTDGILTQFTKFISITTIKIHNTYTCLTLKSDQFTNSLE